MGANECAYHSLKENTAIVKVVHSSLPVLKDEKDETIEEMEGKSKLKGMRLKRVCEDAPG